MARAVQVAARDPQRLFQGTYIGGDAACPAFHAIHSFNPAAGSRLPEVKRVPDASVI